MNVASKTVIVACLDTINLPWKGLLVVLGQVGAMADVGIRFFND